MYVVVIYSSPYSLSITVEGVRFGEVQIPVESGEIVAYTYRPANAAEGTLFPLLINFHGRSFIRISAQHT